MNPRFFVPLGALCLFACTPPEGTNPAAGRAPAATPLSAPQPAIAGYDAYLASCASCHNSGANGAPVTGDPLDWEGRSPMWQAVLMEHAKTGYINMPARGGDPDLSDATLMAAVEYMLAITFPDRPPD